MANIVIISTLYPQSRSVTPIEKTYAIHNFAKEWVKKGHKVYSVVPNSNIPEKFSMEEMDGVKILSVNYFLPFGIPSQRDLGIISYFFKLVGVILKHRIIYRIRPKGWKNRAAKIALANILRTKSPRPDCIVVHGSRSLSLARYLYPLKGKVFLTLHQTDLLNPKDTKINVKKYKPNFIGYRSYKIREKAETVFPEILSFPGQKIISSGIPEAEIQEESLFFRPLGSAKIKMVTVARLLKSKNIDTLIKTISKLPENFSLDIIGEGKEEGELKSLAREDPRINFLGFLPRDKVLSRMADYDIFILVSRNETLGLVYLEAMSQGLIVIGSKDEGIDGIIKNGINGFLVSSGNEEELFSALNSIAELNKDEISALKMKSLETIRDYSAETVAEKYLRYIFS